MGESTRSPTVVAGESNGRRVDASGGGTFGVDENVGKGFESVPFWTIVGLTGVVLVTFPARCDTDLLMAIN